MSGCRTSPRILATFDRQDSGCRSYGVDVGGCRLFVKASVEVRAVPSLQRAVALHEAVRHEAIIPLLGAATTSDGGMLLVYPWVDGEVLYGAPLGGRPQRLDPGGPHARFRALPVAEVLAAVDEIFDAHLAVTAAGFVAVDLYDGCFIYDFHRRRMQLCDLDEYRPGPFVVEEERLPGSTRFMAPEEFERGATIDERTTVFNLARSALVLLDSGDLDGTFRGGAEARDVLTRATEPQPDERFPTVAEFVSAWRRATTRAGKLGAVLHGPRVILRPVTPDDVEPLAAMFALPELAEAWPGDNRRRLDSQMEGDGFVGFVIEREGERIGYIRYYEELDPNYRFAGIDIALHPSWCDQGFGTEALRTLARHLFEDLGHHRIMIDPRATNGRAIASYRKVGFRDVGIMRRYEQANDGTWHDALLMDLLREELTQ